MPLSPTPLGFAEGPSAVLDQSNTPRALRLMLWALVCWIVVFWQLTYLPVIDPDEAHYTEITREMRQLNDYLVPRIDGVPIIDKPALFHWIQAASFSIFGEDSLGARVPTALAALALMWTTFWLGRRLFGRETGERAALMFALMPLTFVLARIAIFDMIFNACLFGALALLIVSALERRPRLQIPGFVLLSLAVQIKGPFVLIVVVATMMFAAFSRETREALRRIHWITGLTAAVILALPWFLLMWREFGQQFIDGYILYNNVQLFAAPLYRRSFHPFFYVRVSMLALFPWMLVCVGAFIDAVRHRRNGEAFAPKRVLLWAWVAVVFVFFSASRFKLDHYIFPIAPAVALLVADAWQTAATDPTRRYRFTAWSLVVTGLALLAIGVVGTVAVYTVDLAFPPMAAAMPVFIGLGGIAWLVVMWRRRFQVPRSMAVLAAALLVIYVGGVLVALPVFHSTRPGANLAKWLRPHLQQTDNVVVYKQGRWKASFRYYLEHPVLQTDFSTDLLAKWKSPNRTYAVLNDRDVELLRQSGLPMYQVHDAPAIVGTTGKIIRSQVWGKVLIVTNQPPQ